MFSIDRGFRNSNLFGNIAFNEINKHAWNSLLVVGTLGIFSIASSKGDIPKRLVTADKFEEIFAVKLPPVLCIKRHGLTEGINVSIHSASTYW